eukprot:g30242.t1
MSRGLSKSSATHDTHGSWGIEREHCAPAAKLATSAQGARLADQDRHLRQVKLIWERGPEARKAQFAAAGNEGAQAEKALGRSGIELSIRKVAKHSGDCRHIVRLCEDGFAEATRHKEAAEAGEAPDLKKRLPQTDNDPLAEVRHFPTGHQILLGTLSQSERQDVAFTDLFQRYKAMLARLKQPLASKPQVNSAVSALEQRGLVHLRKKRSKGRGTPEQVVELVVSRNSLRDVLCEASPLLKHCFSEA